MVNGHLILPIQLSKHNELIPLHFYKVIHKTLQKKYQPRKEHPTSIAVDHILQGYFARTLYNSDTPR